MEPIAKERDRLLYRTTRALGMATATTSLIALSVPGMMPTNAWLAMLGPFVVLFLSLYALGRDPRLPWAVLGIFAGIVILVIANLPFAADHAASLPFALAPLAGGTLASFSLVLTTSVPRLVILGLSFGTATVLTELVSPSSGILSEKTIIVIVGWLLIILLGFWLSSSVPRTARRIYSIGRAHRAERQASEIEAQRRQSARLLHDTVLATLTLFAHSGVGVSPDALKQQAREDAQLLRQLRLGATPVPGAHQATETSPVAVVEIDPSAGTTLESVKSRFHRIGLEVSWHGTSQVLLPHHVLDAFLLALAECLENVRRHAGVKVAHVTITDDETTVRAMVTDSGVGFDVKDIDSARMGLKESVVGRLGEVGGNARLFSAPGAGTTVVLEVPK
ncbi:MULTISPECIES: ATP-binding protein [unclassified Cryobacterium]|uniref:ATP-binding protein n=1 Tax=unclassified Cryobacterium TaxID=2649013 RepID=UPI00144557D6